MAVTGSQRRVSMHGRVIGPLCLLCGEHAVQEMGLGQLIPRACHCQGFPMPYPLGPLELVRSMA